ncbi:hypothetical protein [Brevifollis gellanilyticus]|uniref:Uncharacterized protein n=1 Tax=Brevifollis gellanilyticus TaxID=748831 RepID=A0A512M920_9BACT|nr:hypothetical protein [Brevifollis gellanilyticus]GEP43237.1 hypothetical protein BGE01nite_25280 [Brevifollis gellanilyticus]
MESLPPPVPPPNTTAVDHEHLRLLTIFHYVLAGVTALFACLPIIHVVIGAALIMAPEETLKNVEGNAPPSWVGWLFVGLGSIFVLIGWTMAVLTYLSGRYIAQRRKSTFSMVIAGIQCAFVPLGTVLGIFTLIVLQRDSVRRLYQP